MTDEQCGYETADETECQLPASREDGRCHHHTEASDEKPAGRPTTFNDEDAHAALDAAEKGVSQAGCARAAGIPESTLRNWLDAESDFARSFARARARGESVLVEEGLRDPDVDSSMAKFLLSTSFDYVKTEKREHEHAGKGGGPLEVVIGGDDD